MVTPIAKLVGSGTERSGTPGEPPSPPLPHFAPLVTVPGLGLRRVKHAAFFYARYVLSLSYFAGTQYTPNPPLNPPLNPSSRMCGGFIRFVLNLNLGTKPSCRLLQVLRAPDCPWSDVTRLVLEVAPCR